MIKIKLWFYIMELNEKNKSLLKSKRGYFVGRIVKEKGVQLYVDAIKNIYQSHKEWRFKIVGSPKLGESKFDNFSYRIKKDLKITDVGQRCWDL